MKSGQFRIFFLCNGWFRDGTCGCGFGIRSIMQACRWETAVIPGMTGRTEHEAVYFSTSNFGNRSPASAVVGELLPLGFSRSLNRFQPLSRQFCTSLVPRFVRMSFAGRRRGNKVKKGVQFTVMVVGQSSLQTYSEGISKRAFLCLLSF